MSASPLLPSELDPVTDGATACDHLTELGATRSKMQEFLEWMLTDVGALNTGFLEALAQQLLVDAAKKGWFIRTNPSTGYLELIEKLPIAGLDGTDAEDGDTIAWNEDDEVWEVRNAPEIYLAPTSGGSTVPAVTAGGLLTVAHGLGAAPQDFGCYLECNAADIDYAVGDRVDAAGLIILRDTGGEQMQAVTVSATATHVRAAFQIRAGAGGEYRLINPTTFARAAIDPAKWNVKLYASLY